MRNLRTLTVLVVASSCFGIKKEALGSGPSDAEMAIHIYHESGGNDRAIGDRKLRDKAYGPLQIRQPVITDVNRRYGTKYRPEQMLGNRALSIEVAKKYWAIYATEKRLGRPVTAVDRAGIWNGGPNGWKSSATAKYRRDFKAMQACRRAGKPLKDWGKYKN